MDRLISEQKAIEAINDYWGEMKIPTIDGYINAIKTIPSAEPYKGMTNGEVVKAVLGFKPRKNTCIIPKSFCNGNPAECDGCKYNDWWNSPYEPQVVEGEKNVQIDKQALWDRAGTSNHITRADVNVRQPKDNSGTQALNEGYAPISQNKVGE